MKILFTNRSTSRLLTTSAALLLLLSLSINLYFLSALLHPVSNAPSQVDQKTRTFTQFSQTQDSQITSSPPHTSPSSIETQAEQKLSEGQNDLSVANNIITWSGFVLACLFGIVTILG